MSSDIKYEVKAGFFDAINEDRTYSADDMNRPYRKLISNGVFATPKGEASDYLQVFAANNGMNVIVSAGYALIGDKWFENPSDVVITIPQNPEVLSRIDSIIAQVDKTQSGRVGNIVFRQGEASNNPVHPDINTENNISEFRLADIIISPSCVKITQDLITDCRGSDECPWVTSLIYQVDTSTLYAQWQAAYQKYYEDQEVNFSTWFEEMKTIFQESYLTNYCKKYEKLYTTTVENESNIEIGISQYNVASILEVYVEGRILNKDEYTINGTNSITLTTPLSEKGTEVLFVVYRSMCATTEDFANLKGDKGDSGAIVFDSVADMKADTDLVAGDTCQTLGYYSVNDGGAGLYKIVNDNTLDSNVGLVHNLSNSLKAVLVSTIPNSLQFGVSESNEDNTEYFQALFNYSKDGKAVELIGGTYKITNSLQISVNASVLMKGNVVIEDYSSQITTLEFVAGETSNSDRNYVKSVFDNSHGSLTFENKITTVEKSCICLGSSDYTFTDTIRGLNFRKYTRGILANSVNFYISEFDKLVFFNCEEGVKITGTGLDNSGENIRFKDSVFTRCSCCVRSDVSMDLKFENCSFDFNSCLFFTTYGATIICERCHLEGIGNRYEQSAGTYENASGIIYSADNSYSYNETTLKLKDCMLCYLNDAPYPKNLFDGSSLKVEIDGLLVWFSSDSWKNVTADGAFDKIFACSDKVREIKARNVTYKYGHAGPVFFLKSDNEIEAFFETADIIENKTLYDVSSINFGKYECELQAETIKETKIRFEEVDGYKSLVVTPHTNGNMACFKLRYKDYIPLKGNKWQCFAFTKGFKAANMTYATYSIEVYDKDLNLLTTFNNIATNYNGTDSPNKWFTNSMFNSNNNSNNYVKNTLPSNAMYYKPVISINALRGSFTTATVDDVEVTATDPVYFTGFYCYNFN